MKLKNRALLTVGLTWAMTSFASPALAGPPEDALKALQAGNARFVAGAPTHPHSGMDRVTNTGANGQKPTVTILGCSDSRLALERIFDQGLGDMFVVRVAGNVADGDEIGSAEYGTGHLGTPLMVVLGHTKCGAVTAVATGAQVHGSIPGLVDNIIPAVEAAKKKHPGVTGKDIVPFAIDENVWQSVADTLKHSEEIRNLVKAGKLQIVGAVYDIDTGKVNWLGQHPDQSALLTAPVTSPAAQTGGSHAAHGTPGTDQPKTVTGNAAEASKVASTGSFSAPELKVAPRAAFGPKAGKATEYEAVKPPTVDNGLFFHLFAGGAGLALLLTVGAVFSLSRSTKQDGTQCRAFTLGTKLAGGFGTVVTGLLVMAMLSSRASSTVSDANAEAAFRSNQEMLVQSLNADMWATRTYANRFLMTNSDEDLVKYSDYTASFAHKHDLAKQTINSPERVKLVENIGTAIDEYEHKFAEVVTLIDQRNSIIDEQMGPAATRATELLVEIANTAHKDGDDELAFGVAESNEKLQQARLAFFKYMRTGDIKYEEEALKTAGEVEKELAAVRSLVQNPKRVAWFKECEEAIRFWNSRMDSCVKMQEERNELVHNGLDKIGPVIRKECEELVASLDKTKAEVTAKAEATAAASKIQVGVISGIIAFIGAFLAVSITRAVQRPIAAMIAQITQIRTSNDLTSRVEVRARDEIGRLGESFNGMIQTLHDIIAEVKAGSVQIDAGGQQIASASQSMAQGASEQASSLQQISASLEEISGQTTQSAENARQANTLAEDAKKSADRGQLEMSQMSKAVNEIKASSGEISKIIKVIDEIAFQTNLLALNAAVEAARAGEAGKGFAVVAEEVRNLAQRSAEAAKNTSSMIEESVRRSENGVQIAGRVGQALEEITVATNKVNTLLSEIASAAGEQSTGVNQINQGVGQLDQVTQQNAGNSEELASSAEEMSSQVSSLNDLVNQFKVSENGLAQRPTPTATRPKPPAPSQPAKAPKAFKNAAPKSAASKPAGGKSAAERMIPMENDEALASF